MLKPLLFSLSNTHNVPLLWFEKKVWLGKCERHLNQNQLQDCSPLRVGLHPQTTDCHPEQLPGTFLPAAPGAHWSGRLAALGSLFVVVSSCVCVFLMPKWDIT